MAGGRRASSYVGWSTRRRVGHCGSEEEESVADHASCQYYYFCIRPYLIENCQMKKHKRPMDSQN
jgi:hypothetical protein